MHGLLMGQTRFTPPTPPLQGGEKTKLRAGSEFPPLQRGGRGGLRRGSRACATRAFSVLAILGHHLRTCIRVYESDTREARVAGTRGPRFDRAS